MLVPFGLIALLGAIILVFLAIGASSIAIALKTAVLLGLIFLSMVIVIMSVKVVPKNRRLLILRLGKFAGIRGPGIVIVDIIEATIPIDLIPDENKVIIPIIAPGYKERRAVLTLRCYRPIDNRMLGWIVNAFFDALGRTIVRAPTQQLEEFEETLMKFTLSSIQRTGCRLLDLKIVPG